MRKTFLIIAILLIADIALQFYFAAFGVFSGEHFDMHAANGSMVLPALGVLVIIAAALARAGARTIWLSVLPLVLVEFQTVLFILGGLTGASEDNPTVAGGIVLGFHALVGLSAFVVSYMLIVRARRLIRTGNAVAPKADAAPVAS